MPNPPAPRWLVTLGVTVVSLAAVLVGKGMIALRLRRAPEGWRRTVGVLLRSEFTRFALSAFGVRLPGNGAAGTAIDSKIADALVPYLASEPDAHFSLQWDPWVTRRRSTGWVDVVLLRFSAAGDLAAIEPHLSPARADTLDLALRDDAHRRIIDAYNRTKQLPEASRPAALLKALIASLPSASTGASVHAYVHRLLQACCLSVETIDLSAPKQRFSPPQFSARRSLGFGYLSVVARPDRHGRAADLWFSAHHVGLDGVPLQELVSRLERAWGTAEGVLFPTAGTGAPFVEPRVCSAPGERRVDHLITFVDFTPIKALRKDLNARYGVSIGGEVTFGALLAWLLNREPEFAGVRVASTVDVAASGGYDRDVDVVPLRPADFTRGDEPWGGFVEYAREFNRLIAASRTRTSPLRLGMQTAGLLPAWAHAQAVRANPAALDTTFGTLCITIVRHAKVFVAPMTDLGLSHGFLAIGSADLSTADRRRVTSVSIKGDAGTVAHYPAILQRVIDRCASSHAAPPA